jgi:hypothetical protein
MATIQLEGARMSLAGPEEERSPLRRQAQLSGGCWIDLYEGPWFTGKLRRLYGPVELHTAAIDDFRQGSMIVGPEAKVVTKHTHTTRLCKPKQLIPDLARFATAGKLEGLEVRRADE